MKNYKKIIAASVAFLTVLSAPSATFADTSVSITVEPEKEICSISPYIYGVNSGVDMSKVSPKSFRLGGNRMSAYNWENNMSNAGSDYKHMSDMYLITNAADEFKRVPGGAALDAAKTCTDNDVPYGLLTLQMLGYASSSKRGSVSEDNAAPSDYWVKVENRKNEDFSLEPDKKDNAIYMDEYLNYLFEKIGKSDSGGFKGFALDNEPALWQYTHCRVQTEPLTCLEIVDKSKNLASLVKNMDPGAEVFGPALFGYSAYCNFTGTPDWEQLRSDNNYRWFIDYYLDEMNKAEKECGRRLLDVLDLHFYTEAKGVCGERSCNHYDNDECVKARLNSVRSLYDPDYREDSWITDTGAEFFPLLPNVQQSIDKYYPGTKLAFTEYNFGGGDHISGAVAEADMLGIFAEYGVYFATIWAFDNSEFQLSAINMFTDYDGHGSGFGDTLVESSGKNEDISIYSSVDSSDPGAVKIIVTNRSLHNSTPVMINLASEEIYENVEVYLLDGDTPEIKRLDDICEISDNKFEYELPHLSVTEFVVRLKSAAEDTYIFDRSENDTDKKTNIPLIAGIGAAAIAAAAGITFLSRWSKKR